MEPSINAMEPSDQPSMCNDMLHKLFINLVAGPAFAIKLAKATSPSAFSAGGKDSREDGEALFFSWGFWAGLAIGMFLGYLSWTTTLGVAGTVTICTQIMNAYGYEPPESLIKMLGGSRKLHKRKKTRAYTSKSAASAVQLYDDQRKYGYVS
jgi:hypothetical protein